MIILMGLAGSGKSTQGKILAAELNRVWLSAGQVLREQGGGTVHEIQNRGELVPDTLTIPLMTQAIQAAWADGKEVILDGYPRSVDQAEWIAANMAERIEAVVWLEVPKEELLQRLSLRGRSDDMDRQAIEERLRIVEQNFYAVCEILGRKGVQVVKISGVGEVTEVTERLAQTIAEILRNRRTVSE